MIHFLLLISRHGKIRLSKFYTAFPIRERDKMLKEIKTTVIGRNSKLCNFLEWRDMILVAKRYASLYFVAAVDKEDNELSMLNIIHSFVEVLDKYFNSVCELDIIFNFHKAYYILDEMIMGGYVVETSKTQIQRIIASQESQFEDSKEEDKKGKPKK
mmetsp:Transcript_10077/g.10026  ORF Transcript_10077/g.10026 Transcript_10077/m.10026 type:complete len:157 (+) Transcript_10077:11-481(+)